MYLCNTKELTPVELAFQEKYGTIVSYRWFATLGFLLSQSLVVSATVFLRLYFSEPLPTVACCRYGKNNIIVGFSNGYFVVLSAKTEDLGQELYQHRHYKSHLSDVAVSEALHKAATCGDNSFALQLAIRTSFSSRIMKSEDS